MRTFLPHFLKHESGVTPGEYALITVLIWFAIMLGVRVVSAHNPPGTVNITKNELH